MTPARDPKQDSWNFPFKFQGKFAESCRIDPYRNFLFSSNPDPFRPKSVFFHLFFKGFQRFPKVSKGFWRFPRVSKGFPRVSNAFQWSQMAPKWFQMTPKWRSNEMTPNHAQMTSEWCPSDSQMTPDWYPSHTQMTHEWLFKTYTWVFIILFF